MSAVTSPIAYAARCGATPRADRIQQQPPVRAGHRLLHRRRRSILVLVLYLNRNNTVEGTDVSVAWFMLPGVLALAVFISGAYGIATVLATEREDGTLLRLKSVPYGIVGYVAGQTVRVTLEIAFSMLLILVPALFIVPGLLSEGLGGVLGAVGYIALGPDRRAAARLRHRLGLPQPALRRRLGHARARRRRLDVRNLLPAGVDGDLGAGRRAAAADLLAGSRACARRCCRRRRSAVEIDGSWRTLATIGVLLAWAVVGLALAPVLLRRMARRESGSARGRAAREATAACLTRWRQ